MSIKKIKAVHTATHVVHNQPEPNKKSTKFLLVNIPASEFLKVYPDTCVIEPSCPIVDVLDYYQPTKRHEIILVTSSSELSCTIKEHMYTSASGVLCFDTGEQFSFNNYLHMNARLYAISGDRYFKRILCSIAASSVGIEYSRAGLKKRIEKYGVSNVESAEIAKSKNASLLNVVRDNLLLSPGGNITDVTGLSEISTSVALAVKAMTGAGKNAEFIDPLIRTYLASGKKVSFISSLKTIINKNSATHSGIGEGFVSYETGANNIDYLNPKAFSVCINSLGQKIFLEQVLSSDLVVIDEIESCIRNILLGNDNPKAKNRMAQETRKLIIESLFKVIKTAPYLVVADADISPLTSKLLTSIRPDIRIFNIEQDYSHITVSTATKDMVFQEATAAVTRNDEPVVVLFDRLRDLKVFLKGVQGGDNKSLNDETALEESILVLNSETHGRDAQKEFLENPNAVIKSGKYRAILCSPTLGRGFSITEHYTDKIYIIANGTLDPAGLIQFPRRFRTATSFVYGVNTERSKTVDHTQHLAEVKKEGTEERFFADLLAEYKTEHELLTSNIAITLPEALKALKFTIVDHSSLDASKEDRNVAFSERKQNSKKLKASEIKAVLSESNLSDSEALELESKEGKTGAERFRLTRYDIQKQTGVKDITEMEVKFCTSFNIDAYNLFHSDVYPYRRCLVRQVFGEIASGYDFTLCEIVVNQKIASSLVERLQAKGIGKTDVHLPKPLRIGDARVKPDKALSMIRAMLDAAGFQGRRVKRMIDGRSINCYVYIMSPYARTAADYFT
ncbi:hypothetical protein R8N28_21135 [Vibrio sp. Vb1554]|uniref:hypothetical protein n=1 Tax=Vibrio sp. Vb1554 TaxID=3074642 RepID=UPI002966E355|nr:hypothetical protein [Vibrio sp. Vb1554]MDW3048240.1 hypothetical protein [Vibrio sp. Vb1554]